MYCRIADKFIPMYDGDKDDYTNCTWDCDCCLIYIDAVQKEKEEYSYNNIS